MRLVTLSPLNHPCQKSGSSQDKRQSGVSRNGYRRLGRLTIHPLGAALTALLLFSLAGCTSGFKNLLPHEKSTIYNPLFYDLTHRFDSPEWLWVRGSFTGNFDGDSTSEKEAVIATLQAGDELNPGPIKTAYLVVSKITGPEERFPLARIKLFSDNPLAHPNKVEGSVFQPEMSELYQVSAQTIRRKLSRQEDIAVFFFDNAHPANVWLTVYQLTPAGLVKKLDISLRQDSPGLLPLSLSKWPEGIDNEFQLVIPSASLPDSLVKRLGKDFVRPLWGHVFDYDRSSGLYYQADGRYGEYYVNIANAWNQAYLTALLQGDIDNSDLAWFEYHLALLNHRLGRDATARKFLDKASQGAKDELRQSVARAEELFQNTPLSRQD